MRDSKATQYRITRTAGHGLLAAVVLALILHTTGASVLAYEQVINVDINSGGSPTYAGKGAVGDTGTTWNGFTGAALTDMTASDGTPTGVDFSGSGASGFFDAGSANALHRDRLYTTPPNVSANWSLSDLIIGRTYDLFFYGTINATYTADTGIAEGSVSASITSGAEMALATPNHTDWVAGTHYAVIRVTPTAALISGTYTPPTPANQSSFSGLQIALVPTIPTLSEWGMITLIGLVVGVMGRRMLRQPAEPAPAAT